MPKPKSPEPVQEVRNERETVQFVGFVNIYLDDAELKQIDAAMLQNPLPDMPLHIDYLMDIGKLTLNYNRGSIQATLTVLEGSSAGYAVSGYSDSLIEAILIVRLKVQNYLDKFPALYKNPDKKSRRG